MLMDLTLTLPADFDFTVLADDQELIKKLLDDGHIGTHFDVVDKTFPIESFRTNGKIFDISHIRDREVEIADLAGQSIDEGDTIIFYTGYMKQFGYSREYADYSAELSDETVEYLLGRKIRIIAVDAAGGQKPKKHKSFDQHCADHDVFVVENLDKLEALLERSPKPFLIYTAPLNRQDMSGLPCRVFAEIPD
jgi:kynurenine formamidase